MFCFSATSLSDAWFVFLLASVILASNPSMLSSLISRSCTRISLSHFSLFFSLSFIFLKIQMNYDFWCFKRNKSTKCFYMYLAIAAFSCAYDEIGKKITIFYTMNCKPTGQIKNKYRRIAHWYKDLKKKVSLLSTENGLEISLALWTDWRTDKVIYRIASLLNIFCSIEPALSVLMSVCLYL